MWCSPICSSVCLMKPNMSLSTLAYISRSWLNSSLCSVWVQMEKGNLIGYCKWPLCLQQTNCQALHMKKGLKMRLTDVHVMSAMWVSGEWVAWITDIHKNIHKMSTHTHTLMLVGNLEKWTRNVTNTWISKAVFIKKPNKQKIYYSNSC